MWTGGTTPVTLTSPRPPPHCSHPDPTQRPSNTPGGSREDRGPRSPPARSDRLPVEGIDHRGIGSPEGYVGQGRAGVTSGRRQIEIGMETVVGNAKADGGFVMRLGHVSERSQGPGIEINGPAHIPDHQRQMVNHAFHLMSIIRSRRKRNRSDQHERHDKPLGLGPLAAWAEQNYRFNRHRVYSVLQFFSLMCRKYYN